MEYLTPFMEGISQNCASATKLLPGASHLFSSAVVFFHLAHFQKCHQERQSGFSTLIFISPVRRQPVSTTACSRIVQCDLKIVVSQEPVERAPRLFTPTALSRHPVSLPARRHLRASFPRLLVESGLLGCLGIKPLRTDGHEMALRLAPLKCGQPIQRFKARGYHLFVPRAC